MHIFLSDEVFLAIFLTNNDILNMNMLIDNQAIHSKKKFLLSPF